MMVDAVRFSTCSQWAKCQDADYLSSEFIGTKGGKIDTFASEKWESDIQGVC